MSTSLYTKPYFEGAGQPCVLPGVYLAWYNGEAIQEALGMTKAECEDQCRQRVECVAWTLNTNNGWCALKRGNQIKQQEREAFISGFKYCSK